jgi:hypothetical protein
MDQTSNKGTMVSHPSNHVLPSPQKTKKWSSAGLPSIHQNDSLLGMAASFFDVESMARSMLPESSFQHFLSQPPARPEEITSQVLAELATDLFDFPTEDIFDTAELEPLPLNEQRMDVVDRLAPPQSKFSLLEDTLNQVLSKENLLFNSTHPQVFDMEPALVAPSSSTHSAASKKRQMETEQEPEEQTFKRKRMEEDEARRFRPYQAEQWSEKFDELCQFKKEKGHCCVPHTYKENAALARWVKRQRYQYKLKNEGNQATMTDERVVALTNIGFVWDSHGAAWIDRRNELKEYHEANGHSNVPSNYPSIPQLATWVKCQRRQYKLFWDGKTSNMTLARIAELEKLEFEWELRGSKVSKTLGF